MAAALPAHFKLSSESILSFNEETGDDFSTLDTDEFIVAEALQIRKELKLSEVQQLLDSNHVYPVIKRLIEITGFPVGPPQRSNQRANHKVE